MALLAFSFVPTTAFHAFVARAAKACAGLLIFVATVAAAQSGGALDLAGKPVNPLANSARKPVVLVFLRTDCPISKRYAPGLQALQSAFAATADFWFVFPDKDETASAIQDHLAQFGYRSPLVARDPAHALVQKSQVKITPEVAVFKGGKLLYHGRMDNWYASFGKARPTPTTHELTEVLTALAAGKKPEVKSTSGVGCYISDLK